MSTVDVLLFRVYNICIYTLVLWVLFCLTAFIYYCSLDWQKFWLEGAWAGKHTAKCSHYAQFLNNAGYL